MMSLFIKGERKAIQPTWLNVEITNWLLKPNNSHGYARRTAAKCLNWGIRGILAHCFLLNCFNSVTVKDLCARVVCLGSCQSISIWFKPALSLGYFLCFTTHSEVHLCFRSLFCSLTKLRLSFGAQTGGSTFSLGIFWSWSTKAAPDHHTTSTKFDCWCDVRVF